jgi:hypothetical protein
MILPFDAWRAVLIPVTLSLACAAPSAVERVEDGALSAAPVELSGRLTADLDTLLGAIGVAYTDGFQFPGERLTLGEDSPFFSKRSVELLTFGPCLADGTALEGGTFRRLQNRRVCFFGTLEVEVSAQGSVVMVVYARVSASPAAPDWRRPITATAVVRGSRYRLDADHDSWQLVVDAPES